MPATSGHIRLAAELAFGADFARHARHLAGEGVELVHHRVDGVLQLENFALHIDRDLAREIAARHGRGDLGDVAHLRRQVAGHGVDRVGEILPCAGDARHIRLTTKSAFGADLARDARHFTGEGVSWSTIVLMVSLSSRISPRTSTVILLGEIAVRDGGRDLGDVAHLRREVAGHEVDVVGEILPGTGDTGHLRLAAELAVRADLAGHARDFAGERAQLIHHGVQRVFELEDFAPHVDRDLAREVAASHGGRDFRDVAHLRREVAGHEVDVVGEILPGAGHARHLRLAAQSAFRADFAGYARYLTREAR